jgi:hypothetical protein
VLELAFIYPKIYFYDTKVQEEALRKRSKFLHMYWASQMVS